MKETEKNGFFVCIEGIDGSGKTTQSHRLASTLRKKGYNVIHTAEPSNGVYGKIIKEKLLNQQERAPVVVEAVLFAVDRMDHVQNTILPLLKSGRIVICDRYLYSSIAYQGAQGVPSKWIREINNRAISPDLSIYIDISPEIMINRLQRAKSVMETIENQTLVRKIYLDMVKKGELALVNGDASVDKVSKVIEALVLSNLKKR